MGVRNWSRGTKIIPSIAARPLEVFLGTLAAQARLARVEARDNVSAVALHANQRPHAEQTSKASAPCKTWQTLCLVLPARCKWAVLMKHSQLRQIHLTNQNRRTTMVLPAQGEAMKES
ncbi:hypothetical protein WJX74_002930 [Apatococcus lobatus]|uniref:Uncharacterized protein n=1 Tax=Apatococcus lobatus TaxID=904363 RepID=A0AAW1QMR6_9CHLO